MCQSIFLKESCRILSGFRKVLIGNTIVIRALKASIKQNVFSLSRINRNLAQFIRRISAVSNAIQTKDNEANHLVIYCLNCIRHCRNATNEPSLRFNVSFIRNTCFNYKWKLKYSRLPYKITKRSADKYSSFRNYGFFITKILTDQECLPYCWRALARQHTILVNRPGEKIQNFVGCKIRSLRSRALSGIVETTIMPKSHGWDITRDPHLTLYFNWESRAVRRFRFRGAVDLAHDLTHRRFRGTVEFIIKDPHLTLHLRIARCQTLSLSRCSWRCHKKVGIFSICYVFICFRNHSSGSRTERDQFVFYLFTCFMATSAAPRTGILLLKLTIKKFSTSLLQRAPLFSHYQHYFQPLDPPPRPRKKEAFSTFFPQCGF